MKALFAFAALPLLGGCAITGTMHALHNLGSMGEVGSGHAKTETRTVGNYSKVEVSAGIQATFKEGPASPLTVTADDNLLKHLKTEVRGDTLVVAMEGYTSTRTTITVSGTTPSLSAAEASGASEVNLTFNHGTSRAFESSGAAKIVMTGSMGNVTASISGAGRVEVPDCSMDNLSLEVSGAGQFSGKVHAKQATINASGGSRVKGGIEADSATVDASGGAHVELKAGQLTKSLSGGASISD